MNNRLYGNLIFELSKEGRKGHSLPKNHFGSYEIPASMQRSEEAALPECDELTVVRHYTNLSNNNFGVDTGFYPLGSCTMKYNPKINDLRIVPPRVMIPLTFSVVKSFISPLIRPSYPR